MDVSVFFVAKKNEFLTSGWLLIYLTFDLLTRPLEIQHSTFKNWKFTRSSASHAATAAAHFCHQKFLALWQKCSIVHSDVLKTISRLEARRKKKTTENFNWIGKCLLFIGAQTDTYWALAVLLMCANTFGSFLVRSGTRSTVPIFCQSLSFNKLKRMTKPDLKLFRWIIDQKDEKQR